MHSDGNIVRVWKTYGHQNTLQIGDQIIRINGHHIHTIYQKLLAHIPMDGYNQTGKLQLLNYSFPLWYRNSIEVTDHFTVETADGQHHQLDAVPAEQNFDYQSIVHEPLSLTIEEEVAVIRIPSFAKSYYKSHRQRFKKIIRQYFKRLATQGIKTLLIDVRRNTGGTDSHAAFLAGHFFDQPFHYWDRIVVFWAYCS